MLNRKVPSGAPHAGHYFIRDQQHSITSTNSSNALQIARRRRHRTKCRSADWFENKSCDAAFCAFNGMLQLSRILLPTLATAITAIKTASIAVRHTHMGPLTHHGRIDFPPALVAGNRQRSQRRAVIALRPAQYLVTLL